MTNAASHIQLDAISRELEYIAKLTSEVSPALIQAVQNLLAAMDYADATLVSSNLNILAETMCELVRDTIRNQLSIADSMNKSLRRVWHERCSGVPAEDFDVVGREIGSLIDERIRVMTSLRDGPVKDLANENYSIENSQDLEQGIEELAKLKAGIFRDWPWSNRSLPPVNRQMVADSRAAIARGEKGESIGDLIRRLGGDASVKGG